MTIHLVTFSDESMSRAPVIGVYKITSPSGRVYIGQSWNIRRRWQCHRNDQRKSGRLVQRSFDKYGVGAHSFEIIHQLPSTATQPDLNHWERFYIQEGRQAGVSLLNLTDGGNNGKPVESVRKRLRKPKSESHRANIAKAVARQWAEGKKKPTKLSIESIDKIRRTMTGRSYSAERVAKAANWERTSEWKAKISKGLQGKSSTQKLTPIQVLEIRAKYVPRLYSFRRLASEYKVDNRTVRSVVHRKTFVYL